LLAVEEETWAVVVQVVIQLAPYQFCKEQVILSLLEEVGQAAIPTLLLMEAILSLAAYQLQRVADGAALTHLVIGSTVMLADQVAVQLMAALAVMAQAHKDLRAVMVFHQAQQQVVVVEQVQPV
jgi:hypothetical protein